MRVLFMGTPDFAAASLERLYAEGFDICGVVTQPDRPRGRGHKLEAGPVKRLALTHGTPVFQPEKLRAPETLEQLRALAPDVAAVVAYGRILPREILSLPPLGCVNVHGSLLPKYRGAAPVQWSVLNGDEFAGVTTMYLDEKMDTGDMIDRVRVKTGEYETSGELFGRLAAAGAELLCKTLREVESGTAKREPQNEAEASYAPPLSKDDSPVDWTLSAASVINRVRGLQPWPAATAVFGGAEFKLHAAIRGGSAGGAAPGSVVSAGKNGLEVACGDGRTVFITEIQAAGGKRMRAADYLLGHKIV